MIDLIENIQTLLLDFIFNAKEIAHQPKQGVVKKWYNRYRSRKRIEALKDTP